MNASQFRRYLAKQGCRFETHKGGSGHVTVTRIDEAGTVRTSQIPTHGGSKQLGSGLMRKIMKDLGVT